MKHSDRWNAGLALAAAAIISACAPAVMVNQQSEEQAIRAVNNESMAAFAARDADRVAAIYAPDGVLMTPNSPLISGQSAVRASHAEFFLLACEPAIGCRISVAAAMTAAAGVADDEIAAECDLCLSARAHGHSACRGRNRCGSCARGGNHGQDEGQSEIHP